MKSVRWSLVLLFILLSGACALDGYSPGSGAGMDSGLDNNSLSPQAARHYMENQYKDFEQMLADARDQEGVRIDQLEDGSLKVAVSSEASFDSDSAELKLAFQPTLQEIVDILKHYSLTIVHVIGHTDSVGSEEYNQGLSDKRAESVAVFMRERGIEQDRLKTQGRGEREPVASNDTAAGRKKNRRVELIVKPIVAGHEAAAYEVP